MEASGEVKLRTHGLEQLCPIAPHEMSILVTHNGIRQAPILHHMPEEQTSSLLNENSLHAGMKMAYLEYRDVYVGGK